MALIRQPDNLTNKSFVPEYLVGESIDGMRWKEVAEQIRKDLNLPDAGSRHGLKKIHANFDQVYRKLDSMYKKNKNRPKIVGGIAVLLARMSADATLRDRLFREDKFLPKFLPLLEMKATRNLIIDLLTKLIFNSTPEICSAIANEAPRFLCLIQELPDDTYFYEYTHSLLCSSITMSLGGHTMGHAGVSTTGFRDHIPAILSSVLSAVQKPSCSFASFSAFLDFTSTVASFWNQEANSSELLTTMLVACLRCSNVTYRHHAVVSLRAIGLPDVRDHSQRIDIDKLYLWRDLQARGTFPPFWARMTTAYGWHRCESSITLRSHEQNITALSALFTGGDLCSLGVVYARIAVTDGHYIPAGPIQVYATAMGRQVPRTLQSEHQVSDLADLYMPCAKALRARNNSGDLDIADVLEIGHLRRREGEVAAAHATKALERNPEFAYFYYIIGSYTIFHATDKPLVLKTLKQGLEAKITTPYIRYSLLYLSVLCAGDLGLRTPLSLFSGLESDGGQRMPDGIAFWTSALKDARTFIAEAPPDNLNMWSVLNWYILCRIVLDGPKLSTDLRELQATFDMLDTCRQFSEFSGHPLRKTPSCLACERIVKYYTQAAHDHSSFISNINSWQLTTENCQAPTTTSQTDALLTGRLGDLRLDLNASRYQNAGPNFGARISGEGTSLRAIPLGCNMELYVCSYCGNPSAVIRKCSGCGKTRYCDSKCQKNHWPEHKAACKASRSSLTPQATLS